MAIFFPNLIDTLDIISPSSSLLVLCSLDAKTFAIIAALSELNTEERVVIKGRIVNGSEIHHDIKRRREKSTYIS